MTNTIKGERGLLEIRLELNKHGFASAVPIPDEGEDLWFSRLPTSTTMDREIFRAQVKSVFSSKRNTGKFRNEFKFNFDEAAFERVRSQKLFFFFIAAYFDPEHAKSAGSEVKIGCFRPDWFTSQSWFTSSLGVKRRTSKGIVKKAYNLNLYQIDDGSLLCGHKKATAVDVSEFFEDFIKILEIQLTEHH